MFRNPDFPNPKEKPVRPYDPALPDVLIIGDSISIGYTPCVAQELSGTANVFHLEKNCQGATFICQNIDRRLQHPRPWAVIHFNWGLQALAS